MDFGLHSNCLRKMVLEVGIVVKEMRRAYEEDVEATEKILAL